MAHAVWLSACGLRPDPPKGEGGDGSTSAAETTSETSTGDATTGDPDTDTHPTEDFVPHADTGPQDCDMFAQDCPPGEKCVPYSSNGDNNWDDNKCVVVTGAGVIGESCTYDGVVEGTDDCDATGMCWNAMEVDGVLIGTCHAFCTGTLEMPMCPAGSECLISGDATISLCIPGCDPLAQDCGEGDACYWTGSAFNCLYQPQDSVPLGEPCMFLNDCAPGHFCADTSLLPSCAGDGCCTSFCNLTLGPSECDAVPGTVCTPFFEQPVEGYEKVGLCTVPP